EARRAVAEATVALLRNHADLRDDPALGHAASLLAALTDIDDEDDEGDMIGERPATKRRRSTS
ncbi:MAG: hypothetical protein AAF267_23895, partial [Deinococcota bacterium]